MGEAVANVMWSAGNGRNMTAHWCLSARKDNRFTSGRGVDR